MNNKEKAKIILGILNKTYPEVPIPLNYKNTFTLLVSVLLSAQCTDVNVNNVTKDIYPKYNKPSHFIKLNHESFDRALYSEGALTAATWLMSKKAGLYSMRDLLNFKWTKNKKLKLF